LAEMAVRENQMLIATEPPPRQGGGKVEDVDGMIAKLKELGAI
jgi:electron transfer flavoprotein beta subunit